MKEIKNKIVFSEDIKRILSGINALDFKYEGSVDESTIESVRSDFKKKTNDIFNNKVAVISEEEMLEVNRLISGDYPHCYSR